MMTSEKGDEMKLQMKHFTLSKSVKEYYYIDTLD